MTTKTITAENQWSNEILLLGFFSYSISGTFSATISLQRSFDNGIIWENVIQETKNVSDVYFEPYQPFLYTKPTTRYRIGVDYGDFVSGTVTVRIDAQDSVKKGVSYTNNIITENYELLLTENDKLLLVE